MNPTLYAGERKLKQVNLAAKYGGRAKTN